MGKRPPFVPTPPRRYWRSIRVGMNGDTLGFAGSILFRYRDINEALMGEAISAVAGVTLIRM
jgi:hypothetical protein